MVRYQNFLKRRLKSAHYLSFAPRTVAIDTAQQVVVNSHHTEPNSNGQNNYSNVVSNSNVVSTVGMYIFAVTFLQKKKKIHPHTSTPIE
jgi:hypothetical protein